MKCCVKCHYSSVRVAHISQSPSANIAISYYYFITIFSYLVSLKKKYSTFPTRWSLFSLFGSALVAISAQFSWVLLICPVLHSSAATASLM